MRRFHCLAFLLCVATALGCGRREVEPAAGPGPDSVASPEEQAEASAREPRLLLFDIQTALEATRQAGEAYPTTVEFQADDRWAIHRAALEIAFTEWQYASDGTTYQLTGNAQGRRLAIASP